MKSKIKILIVDDEPAIVETLKYILSLDGFEVIQSHTGKDATETLGKCNPSIIILDIGLPDISGFEVCKEIRKISNVPIIFLTARAEEIDRILGLEMGGDDYITKPFSPREVLARVKAVLRRSVEDVDKINNYRQSETQIVNKTKNFDIDTEKLKVIYKNQYLELSRYEFRLLCILIKRPGKVFSREELMDRAWGISRDEP